MADETAAVAEMVIEDLLRDDSGQRTMYNGQRTMYNGQRTMYNGQLTFKLIVHCPLYIVHCQLTNIPSVFKAISFSNFTIVRGMEMKKVVPTPSTDSNQILPL